MLILKKDGNSHLFLHSLTLNISAVALNFCLCGKFTEISAALTTSHHHDPRCVTLQTAYGDLHRVR